MKFYMRYQEPATGQVMNCHANDSKAVLMVIGMCQLLGYKVLSIEV